MRVENQSLACIAALPDAAWMQWFHDRLAYKFQMSSGNEFERLVTSILACAYPDFGNPDPAGSRGDGGCDGLADSGRLFFACYGQSAKTKVDEKTASKLRSDFNRALGQWSDFGSWTFITNATCGPLTFRALTDLQRSHEEDSTRPLKISLCKEPDDFWRLYCRCLPFADLNELLPGVPHAESVELADLSALLEGLSAAGRPETSVDLSPVSVRKMEYNALRPLTVGELGEGRILAPQIDAWFSSSSDPELRDAKAQAFHEIYEKAASVSGDPSEIMEMIYIAIGGKDFRCNSSRANAVYAIASYFFDSCDIFERVPEGCDDSAD